jgi:hypothetical protein
VRHIGPVLYCSSVADLEKQVEGYSACLVVRSVIRHGIQVIGGGSAESRLEDFRVTGFQDSFYVGGIGADLLTKSCVLRKGHLVDLRDGEFPDGDRGLVLRKPQHGFEVEKAAIESYLRRAKSAELSRRLRGQVTPLPDQPVLLKLAHYFSAGRSSGLFHSSEIDDLPFGEILHFPEYWGGYGCHFYAFSRDEKVFKARLEEVARHHDHDYREVMQIELPVF